jgi:hypothetical protein
MLYLIATEGFTAQTRDEGTQQLSRTEPRSSPVQTFRFRIAAQDENIAAWKRFGAEANLPLRAVVLAGAAVPAQRSFFELSNQAVQMLAFKPAESRPGWYTLRFQESSGKQALSVKLTTPFRVVEALRANTVEEPTGGSVDLANFSLSPWETLTVLVRIASL